MSTTMPQVPPRPARAQQDTSAGSASLSVDIPKIPPRPANRRPGLDRSLSRESYARSPLNETPYFAAPGHAQKHSQLATEGVNPSAADLPRRPPSVTLPSIGQEGSEYADIPTSAEEQVLQTGTSPTQTRNIANDLKLHAPKPSLPVSSAKARVSTVTRTDSSQAAAFGIGKPSGDDREPAARSLKAKASFTSQNSTAGTERSPSVLDGGHGIPEIGQRVPMYPNAGDVQAPSPSSFAQPFAPGIGFHNDGSKPRHHGRKTSTRDQDIPADAYGRYGHGAIPHDRFEAAYYEKHPELFKKELGQYGEGRPEWAMSSEDLNRIVRDTASHGNAPLVGTPSEQVGYQAGEEYASRISSPRQTPTHHVAHHPNVSEFHVDSPLRQEAHIEDVSKAEFEGALSRSLNAPSNTTLHSEADPDVIHVDARRSSRVYGADYNDSFEHLERQDSRGGESEYEEAPILAPDEVAKEPFGWALEPAVSPQHERRSSSYEDPSFFHHRPGSQSSANNSRPSSRPGSIHGAMSGLRLPSAPLEDLNEYEPLFPEEEEGAGSVSKPLTAADRLSRPALKNRKFPSQDIWEDTPNSLQYTATVSTPQLPEEQDGDSKDSPVEETSAHAFARRQEQLAEQESLKSGSTQSFVPKDKKIWDHKAHLAAETRPSLSKQRFPSRDIWEDTPDSLQLQTTVASPQVEDIERLSPDKELSPTASIPIPKPQIATRPVKSSQLAESPEKAQPPIPERPRPKQVEGTSPPLPVKAKPQVPARPAKLIARGSSENVPLTSGASNATARPTGLDQGAAAKPKPPVPSRPVGSKIAALQGGFMADLNKRLQLGAQPPKKEEAPAEEVEVKEKAPLVDARKGRARGPARRAPAKSPAPPATEASGALKLSFSTSSTIWEIDPENGSVLVSSYQEPSTVAAPTDSKATESETLAQAHNIVDQPIPESAKTAHDAESSVSLRSPTEDKSASKPEGSGKGALAEETKGSDSEVEPPKESDKAPAMPGSFDPPPLGGELESPEGDSATSKAAEAEADLAEKRLEEE